MQASVNAPVRSSASSGEVFLGDGLSWRRSSKANVRSAVFAQAVVDGGDPRQRKISELDTLVIWRKQNDAREHVANLTDNLGQGCILYVCHVPPHFFTLRKIAALDEPDEFIPFGMIQLDGIFVFPNRDYLGRSAVSGSMSGLPERHSRRQLLANAAIAASRVAS